MKPAIASTVSGSEARKITRLETSIHVLQSDHATQETVGERLRREVDEKLNKTSPERLAPLKAILDITKSQMAQLKEMINSPHDLALTLEEMTHRERKAQLHSDYARATKEFEEAKAHYVQLRGEFSQLPERIQQAFSNQSEALRARNQTQTALQAVGDFY